MSKQILFCIETNQKADTDYQYIKATIGRFYIDTKKIVYRPVYLNSKTRYKDQKVLKDLAARIRAFPGDTVVVYCIDYDDSASNPETKALFNEIQAFCRDNGYEFVYFCRDVEDVYLGDQVADTEKVRAVARFIRKRSINDVDESQLKRNDYKRHHSNILGVLDRYWVRKR